ncbi:hypothetical protein TNCV_2624911 [Trichonephila clavipes]|nr:hypothetical protein TNCV_2624911 [Trichonephila clavipes]
MTIPRLELCACLLSSYSQGHISSKDADRVRAVVVRVYNCSLHGLIPSKPAQDLRVPSTKTPTNPHPRRSSDVIFYCLQIFCSVGQHMLPWAPEEYVEELQTWTEELHRLARDRIGMASEKMKTRYDARANGHDFHEGDKVSL